MFMSGKDFRESLRAYKPSVYVNGRKVRQSDIGPRGGRGAEYRRWSRGQKVHGGHP